MRALQVLIAASVLWHAGCARLSDRRAAYLAKGKAYLEQKDGARAVLEYRNAVRLDPKDAEAHYQLGMAYLMAKAVPQAFAEFSQTVQLKPSHTQAHVRMAELMIATDDQELRDAAYGRMQWLLQQSPGDSDALTAMAFAELKSGKPREAERDLMRAVEHAPAAVKPAGLLAGVRLANGDTAGAEKILKETVGSNPRSQEAAVALGRFYVLTGREGEAEGQFRRALELDPKNGMALIDLGAVQMRAGRKSEAEESYRRASASGSRELRATHALYLIGEKRLDAAVAELRGLVRKDPEDRHARTLLVDALLAAKQREAAVEVLSRALAANGRDVDALLQRARIEIAEGEFGEAERDLRSVLSLDNGSAAGHLLLARVQLGRENWDGYRRELEETLRRDGYILQARLELADTLIAKRGFAAALDLLNATPDRQKGDLGVTVRRNRALMEAGSWDEAERSVRAGLSRQRADELLAQEARIRMHRKDPTGARKIVEEILNRAPDNVPALEVLAEANAAEARKPETLRELDRLAARVPHSAAVQRYRGVQLLAMGRAAEAREALVAARAADPNDLASAMSLAQMEIDAGRPVAARETLASLPKRHRESVAALVLRALAEERLSNPQGATALYRQVLERDGDNMMALNNLAFLLSETEMHPDQALPFAQRAQEISKGNPAVEDTLGWVYYRKGLYPMARKYLESSVGKQPTAGRKYHLAMTYLKQGERTKGQRLVEEIRQVDPALAGTPALRELLGSPVPQR